MLALRRRAEKVGLSGDDFEIVVLSVTPQGATESWHRWRRLCFARN
jgi:hypothetical protein